jgi:hypothetical protein
VAVLRLRKGTKVAFDHDEVGWIEGTAIRASANGEEWLIRTKLDDRWVALSRLRPPLSTDHSRGTER